MSPQPNNIEKPIHNRNVIREDLPRHTTSSASLQSPDTYKKYLEDIR